MTAKEKHTNDLRLLLGSRVKTVKEQLPKFADALEKRVNDLHRQFEGYLDKDESIRTSGRYSVDGEKVERRLNARGFKEKNLATMRAETVTKLDAQLAEKRAARLKPKPPTTDPTLLLVRELRHRELRDHLRTMDPVMLRARIQQDDGTGDLLDALDGAPAGFPIAPAELVQEARTRIALANDPELGELAQLRDAYVYLEGVVEQTLLAASGLTALEIGTDPTPVRPAA
jgi:hypothetical protein